MKFFEFYFQEVDALHKKIAHEKLDTIYENSDKIIVILSKLIKLIYLDLDLISIL